MLKVAPPIPRDSPRSTNRLLDHILTTSELKQYVEVSTLIRIAQNPVVLFTNITPNSTHGYIKIHVIANSLNTFNLYSTVTSTAEDRFGSSIHGSECRPY